MPRRILILAGAGALLLVMAWQFSRSSCSEPFVESRASPPEPMPLCPWREPDADMHALFPGGTHYEAETRILSGLRVELEERLGRRPSAEENALHLFRIYRDQIPLGTVVTRRVKGDYGAIELVLAIGPDQRVRGWRLQRSREPEPVLEALLDPAWRRSFEGKGADSPWQFGLDIPQVAPVAAGSAAAVVEGARSLLILMAAADQSSSSSRAPPPHPHS
jgi:hypothetical protein